MDASNYSNHAILKDFLSYDEKHFNFLASITESGVKICYDNTNGNFSCYAGKFSRSVTQPDSYFDSMRGGCVGLWQNASKNWARVTNSIGMSDYDIEGEKIVFKIHLIMKDLESILMALNTFLNSPEGSKLEKEEAYHILKKIDVLLGLLKADFLGIEKLGMTYADSKSNQTARVAGFFNECRSVKNLRIMLKELKASLSVQHPELAETLKSERNEASTVGNIYQTSSSFLFNACSAVAGFFYNPQHAWKDYKYELGLQQLIHGIELEGKKLDELHAELTAGENGSSLNVQVANLISILKNCQADPRTSYSNFLKGLRAIITSEEVKEQLAKEESALPCDLGLELLYKICFLRFQGVNIYPFCDYLVHKMIHEGQKVLHADDHIEPLAGKLSEQDFAAIDAAPQEYKAQQAGVAYGKLQGATNIGFDPHLTTNLPYTLGELQMAGPDGASRNVSLLRMGTPTMSGYAGGTSIIPEFDFYLRSLKNQNKNYLYVSLQDFRAGHTSGDITRNQTIKALEEKYPGTFHFVVLAQDSNFYKQQSGVNLRHEVNEFFQEFKEQMLADGQGFYFPQQWKDDPEFVESLDKIMCNTFEALYDEKPRYFSVEEKRDFIEIYYAYLELFLIEYSKADALNITCKDAIDRAGKNISLLVKLCHIAQGHANSIDHQRQHKVITHAPALMVKKQSIIPERRERLMTANSWLDKPEVQQKIFQQASEGLLGIDPNGDVIIPGATMLGHQRPGEQAFINFRHSLDQLMGENLSRLLDLDHFEALVEEYLVNDLFICEVKHEEVVEHFQKMEGAINNLIEKLNLLDDAASQNIKKLVTELFVLSFLKMRSAPKLATKQFSAQQLNHLINVIANDPEEFLKRVYPGHFDANIASRIFNLCYLNVDSEKIVSLLTSEFLESIYHSKHILDFMLIKPNLQNTEFLEKIASNKCLAEIFNGIEQMGSWMDMRTLGEDICQAYEKEGKGDKVSDFQLLLEQMKATTPHLAKSQESPASRLELWVFLWTKMVMEL